MTQTEEYFAAQSAHSDPGSLVRLYADVPRGLPAVRAVVQGLLIHVFRAGLYDVKLPPERKEAVYLYHVSDMLEAIIADDPRPLTDARPPKERHVATCRTYAMMLCSMLRHQGTPARLRNCFASYLKPGKWADHWLCECWVAEEGRWAIVDGQLDAVQREALNIEFDPLDVPGERVIRAGDMWGRCRRGEIDPELCGMMDFWGIDYVKSNVLSDLAALNKVEMLPWDGAALGEVPYDRLSDSELALLDLIAEATWPEVRLAEVRELYSDHPELHAKKVPYVLAKPPAPE